MTSVKGMLAKFSDKSNPHYVLDKTNFQTYIHTIIPHMDEFVAEILGGETNWSILQRARAITQIFDIPVQLR